MVEEKIGGNGEFERPGAGPHISVPRKATERFVIEMEGSLAIIKKYLNSLYYFGVVYPTPPNHKQALEALKSLDEHVAQLKQG